LYPTDNPTNDFDKAIEHIVAISAIRMSLIQHFQMHFFKKKVDIIEVMLKLASIDKLNETMYYPPLHKNYIFNLSDIKVMIGSGGVISAATKEQAIFMMIESLQPEGVTVLWRDTNFTSPHFGVLADVDEDIADYMINSECHERLAIYARPEIVVPISNRLAGTLKQWKSGKKGTTFALIEIEGKVYKIKSNDIFYFVSDNPVAVKPAEHKAFPFKFSQINLKANVPLIIDTTEPNSREHIEKLVNVLRPYKFQARQVDVESRDAACHVQKYDNINDCISLNSALGVASRTPTKLGEYEEVIIPFKLPYPDSILVKAEDSVVPDTVLGEIKYELPKKYVILISNEFEEPYTADEI